VAPKATTLVTHGLYARIRNPVYVFGFVFVAGLVIYLGSPWFPWALLALIPVALGQVGRARREARILEATFGDAYRAYRARTWF